jgi:hypothetical protein
MAVSFSVNGLTVTVCFLMAIAANAPVYASNLTISPTFDTSITSDANAAAIEGVINSAISIYEADFSNPIDVTIDFKEGGGLGQSTTSLESIAYPTFFTAYSANATTHNNAVAQEALADNVVPAGTDNPVNDTPNIWVKTANLKALGLSCGGCPAFDGTISLNTGITFPGSPGSSLTYSLMATAEHEIDEVLGLGSFLGSGLPTTQPLPEDLFRYDSFGARSFTTSTGALAYFSINGTTDLAQFDNQADGGDFGDWQSNPLPGGVQPKVQDAFASGGATPQLGVELIALEAVGYDAIVVPEPASVYLFIVALPVFGLFVRRRATQLSSMRAQPGRDAGSFS